METELLRLVNVYLEENGLKVSRGAIVFAIIINATCSTKSCEKVREPDMHHMKNGNQWYIKMMLRIGFDGKARFVRGTVGIPTDAQNSRGR